MISILLVCSAGMSTSMLVKRMQESAEVKGIDTKIWSVGDADSDAETKEADIVLLGPQVRYLEKKMNERVKNEIPVSVIDMRVYGSMNGKAALESALQLLEEFKKKEN